jgi:hypothetical protein
VVDSERIAVSTGLGAHETNVGDRDETRQAESRPSPARSRDDDARGAFPPFARKVAELSPGWQLASGPLPRASGLDLDTDFVKRFGDLVALLRADPGNDAAQDLALSAAASAVARTPVEVDASNPAAGSAEGLGLRARMIARQVDRLRVAAGAEPFELQALARALAHDVTPIPVTPHVQVELTRLLAPPSR